MKILIITYGYPSPKNLQLGCFMLDQAKALKKSGHEVGMLSIKMTPSLKSSKKFGLSQSEIDGIQCFEFTGIPTRSVRNLLGNSIGNRIENAIVPIIFKSVQKKFGKPDLLHAHFLPNIYIGTIIKDRFQIPLVGTEHWSKITHTPINQHIKKLCQITYPKVDKLIAVSNALQNKIKEYSNQNSIVIHNLIDIENLKPALTKTQNKTFTIIAVGSLIKRKGFDILIEAFSQSFLKDKKVVLKIFGKGMEQEYLESLIKKKGLTEKIILMGQKNKDEIYQNLHSSDLFVLSSRHENFSVALIEATANGLPAIATLCGGVEEYPIDGVIKIPQEDSVSLKNALEEAYNNIHLFERCSIQGQTLEHFSPISIVKQLNNVYKELF